MRGWPRLSYKSLVKKLGVDNHMILGEKYTEAAGLVDIALAAEMDFGGHNVICILDQNMDRYTEGAILGTDVTGRLRECGFKGLIFIRSANDDMMSRVAYKNAGADATLSKGTKSIDDLAKDIVAVRRRFLHFGWCTVLSKCFSFSVFFLSNCFFAGFNIIRNSSPTPGEKSEK